MRTTSSFAATRSDRFEPLLSTPKKISFAGRKTFWREETWVIEQVTVDLEYQIKEWNKCNHYFKMIPVLVSAELHLLYKFLQRQYIEFCASVSTSSRTECKTCISCSRLTSSIDFSLLNTIKIIRMATQNFSLEFCFGMNAYFAK